MVATRKLFSIVLLGFCLTIAMTSCGAGPTATTVNSIKALGPAVIVNQDPIDAPELDLFVSEEKTRIMLQFKEKYHIIDSDNLWTKQYDGESPVDVLIQTAMSKAVRAKVIQELAREAGLTQHIDYTSFLAELRQENQHRATAMDKGEVIYGPSEFSESIFYNYRLSNLLTMLKDNWKKNYFAPSDNDLIHYYESNIEAFKLQDSIQVKKVSVVFKNETERTEAVEQLSKMQAVVRSGATFSDASTQFGLQVINQTFDETTQQSDIKTEPNLRSQALQLSPNQMSVPFVNHNQIVVILCEGREGKGYRSFEEAKSDIKLKYSEQEFGIWLERQIQSAKVLPQGNVVSVIKNEIAGYVTLPR